MQPEPSSAPEPGRAPGAPGAPEPLSSSEPRVIVGAAIVGAAIVCERASACERPSACERASGSLQVLAAQRSHPPRLAGQWEFPGGKVEAGETEVAALRRECIEELAADVDVGPRIGPDLPLAERVVLRIYLARLRPGASLVPTGDHARLRWLGADELHLVPWLPADRPVLGPLAAFLRSGSAEWPADPQGSVEVTST